MVLTTINVSLSAKVEDAVQKTEEVQSTVVKQESSLKGHMRALQEVKGQNAELTDKLNEQSGTIQTLQQENDHLKVKLQAKIERESRREPNLYAAGNCTWYVKERIPYIGGTWGNANQWLASAQADGFEIGEQPREKSIGVSFEGVYGHVVVVEAVNGDGTVTISEMNYGGLYNTNTRTVEQNAFKYIYT